MFLYQPYRALRQVVTMGVLAAAVALGAAALSGCQRHAAAAPKAQAGEDDAQGSTRQSEAERTRAMEDKARQMEQKASEIQNMQGTEQEKIDAVNKLEQDRQELNKMGGDGSAPATPPPQ
jgi:TolA-binding protein